MDVLTLGPALSTRVVVFVAGAGGDPRRHLPLLEALADNGCRVIAPCFRRFDTPQPSTVELVSRLRDLIDALEREASPEAEVTAIGHSIGGWAALCLAGATPYGRDGEPMKVPREPRVGRLVLYAPAAGWFAVPGALDAVTAPMLVYAGALDTVTPVAQATHLKTAPAPVDLRVVPDAGHFSFMHTPPPGTHEDPAFDHHGFLTELTEATITFATAP
ncbi:alpha/beta hydrolase family protein [Nocardia noduli]|uniref:alpha/beta hydrolase family protein n=1 Tax=Nocardia noduli TaxID=2815722 RepID=UPI001C23A1DA|nr:alpha/beta fold hydrolase [Nocardia noduli]